MSSWLKLRDSREQHHDQLEHCIFRHYMLVHTYSSFEPASAQGEERIYGRQLMSDEEARIYGQKMRAAATDGERQQIRAEYQRKMRERAESRGILLPEEAPVRGVGRGIASGKAVGRCKE